MGLIISAIRCESHARCANFATSKSATELPWVREIMILNNKKCTNTASSKHCIQENTRFYSSTPYCQENHFTASSQHQASNLVIGPEKLAGGLVILQKSGILISVGFKYKNKHLLGIAQTVRFLHQN